MSKNIHAIRGMNDILPNETPYWRYVEQILQQIALNYGYQEIRFPLLEQTSLFIRTIGEITDIVEKEMYTFADRNGESLTLRPEGTAGCVRAGIQNGLLYNQIQRIWYQGPMFRHERPQKGRFRQFHQFGVEAFGLSGPDVDAELLLMSARFWDALKIKDKVVLHINTLGTKEVRAIYKTELVKYLRANFELLDEDRKKRLEINPLRILDSKNPELKPLIQSAPKILDYLDQTSKDHFTALLKILDAAKLQYVVDPCLVRGLDYYCLTVFEWITTELGAQGAICAGGHYDGLVEQLGGKATPAMGFALGLERLVSLVESSLKSELNVTPHAYMILLDERSQNFGMLLAEKLRTKLPSLRLIVNCGNANLSSQLKRADKSGADLAMIIGEEEFNSGTITIKHLRKKNDAMPEQQKVTIEELVSFIKTVM